MAMNFVKAFLVGGAICTLGQVIINYTKLTNGKILVLFLISGAILQAFGWYEKLIEFAGAGASIPISGFGCSLVMGATEAMENDGFWGAVKGGLESTALGVSAAIICGYIIAMIFRPRTKKQ